MAVNSSHDPCDFDCNRFDPTNLNNTYVTTDPTGNTIYYRKGYHRCINNHYAKGWIRRSLLGCLAKQNAAAELTEPPESLSGSVYFRFHRYRLKCLKAPNPNDGAAAWTEIASVGGAPQAHNLTLSNTGPSQGEVNYIFLTKIEGTLTSSLLAGKFKESSTPMLGFPKDPLDSVGIDEYLAILNGIAEGNPPEVKYTAYDGSWISADPGNEHPELFYPPNGDGTPVGETFFMSVDGPKSTADIATSGFKIESISVTAQDTKLNSSQFENNTANNYTTEQSAAAGISASGSIEGTIVPVTQKAKVETAVNANMKNSATLVKKRDYKNTASNGAAANFESTQNYSSSVSAHLEAEWTIVVQHKTRVADASNTNVYWESEWETMEEND